jgi:hypothetical protein
VVDTPALLGTDSLLTPDGAGSSGSYLEDVGTNRFRAI